MTAEVIRTTHGGRGSPRSGRRAGTPSAAAPSRLVAAVVGTALAAALLITANREGGYAEQTARIFPGTRWLVDRAEGAIVLADSSTGRATARITTERAGHLLDTVQGRAGAIVLDRSVAEVLSIDQRMVKLSDARPVPALGEADDWTLGPGPDGVVAASLGGTVLTIPPQGAASEQNTTPGATDQAIGLDGTVWNLHDTFVERLTAGQTTTIPLAASSAKASISALGDQGILLDPTNRRLQWLSDGTTVNVPSGMDLANAVLQLPTGAAPCAWIGSDDQLACLGREGVVGPFHLDGLTVRPGDRLAAAPGVVTVVRAGGEVVRIDPGSGSLEVVGTLGTANPGDLQVGTDDVSVWIDDPDGGDAIALTAGGSRQIAKRAAGVAQFDTSGRPLGATPGSAGLGTPQEAVPASGPTSVGRPEGSTDGPPVAVDDYVSALQDTHVRVRAAANDHDPGGGPVAIVSTGPAAHGQVRILDAETVLYQPDAGYVGKDRFDYTITDTDGQQAIGVVNVVLLDANAPNQPPRAEPDQGETGSGRTVNIDVLANDVDPEQGALRIGELVQPAHGEGTATIVEAEGSNPVLRFTPAPGFAGEATFSYRAIDPQGAASPPTTVTVRVHDRATGNHAPVAAPDSARIAAGRVTTLRVLSNDHDPDGDVLAIDNVSVLGPGGRATVDGSAIRFEASADAPPTVTLRYTVSDPTGARAQGTVLVVVVPAAQANGAPVAVPDVATAGTGPIDIRPLTNDIDPDGDPLAIVAARPLGPGGQVTLIDPQRLRFTPTDGWRGTVTIAYTISDGRGGSASSTITVTVVGTRVAGGPTAMADAVTAVPGEPLVVDVLANDSDPNGEPLSISGVGTCAPATCPAQADGTLLLTVPAGTPASTILFDYTIANAHGETASATVRVTVRPRTSPNLPPVAADDTFTRTVGSVTSLPVLTNDRDPDGPADGLSIVAVDPPTDGVSIAADGRSLALRAPARPSEVILRYTVRDTAGGQATARVTVHVVAEAPSSGPTALDDTLYLIAGDEGRIDVVANDVDRNGRNAELHLVGDPSVTSGNELLAGPPRASDARQLVVRARAGVTGQVTIGYTIADRAGRTAGGKLRVTIVARPNNAPVAVDDTRTTNASTPIDIDVLSNDHDPDGDPLSAVIVSPPVPSQGSATVLVNGQIIRFTPAAGFSGTATFTYSAVDPSGAWSRQATVTVVVDACVAAAPSAPDRPHESTPAGTALTLTLVDASTGSRASIGPVSGGTVTATANPGVVVFTPARGFSGTANFTYTVTNRCGASASGTVTVAVAAPTGAVLLARPDSFQIPPAVATTLDVLANDGNPAGTTSGLTVVLPAGSVTVGAASVRLTVTPDGRFVVADAPADAHGRATFTYRVADATGAVSEPTTVALTVNRPPRPASVEMTVAAGTSSTTDIYPGIGNGDPDGDTIVSNVTASTDGRLTVWFLPGLRVQVIVPAEVPAGDVRFTYSIVDALGAQASGTILVHVTSP